MRLTLVVDGETLNSLTTRPANFRKDAKIRRSTAPEDESSIKIRSLRGGRPGEGETDFGDKINDIANASLPCLSTADPGFFTKGDLRDKFDHDKGSNISSSNVPYILGVTYTLIDISAKLT